MPKVNQEKNQKGQTINVIEDQKPTPKKIELEGELTIRGMLEPMIHLNKVPLDRLIARDFTTGDQVKVIVIKRS